MIDRYVVGGFYRVNAERGIDENLNAPGASFVPLAFAESSQLPRPGAKPLSGWNSAIECFAGYSTRQIVQRDVPETT